MRKILLRTTFSLMFISAALMVKTNTGGPGWSYTHAPVSSTTRESNCTSCHGSFSLQTSGTNHGRIRLTGNFTGNGYIPDSSYTITLTYKESGKSKFGYQMTALEETSYKPAGTFSSPDSRSQTGTAVVSGNTRSYAGHTSTGTSAVSTDSTAWRITWKAPNRNVGKVTFWVVLNVTDGSSGTNNDYIYSKSFTFSPSNLLPTAKAKILDNNICSFSELTFGADVTGSPTSYQWSFPSGTPSSSTAQNPKVQYSSSGNFRAILSVKNSKGSSLNDTLNFTVKAAPGPPVISPAGTHNICAGDSIRFTTSPNNGVTYAWTKGGFTTQSIWVKDSGTYFSVITSTATGCSRRSSLPVKVNVISKPEASFISGRVMDTACESLDYTARISRKSMLDSISFIGTNGPWKMDTFRNYRFSKTGPDTIRAWVKNTNGCRIAIFQPIHVKPLSPGPALSISNRTLTGFRVNINPISGSTAYVISLDSGKTFVSTNGSGGLFHDLSGLSGGERRLVYVKALNNSLCGETSLSQIEGRADTCKSIAFGLISDKTSYCSNSSAEISITGINSMTVGSKINGDFKGNVKSFNIQPSVSSLYTIGVLDSSAVQCGYTEKSIMIHVDTVDATTFKLPSSNQVKICTPNSIGKLQLEMNKGKGHDTFFYFVNSIEKDKNTTGFMGLDVGNNDKVTVRGTNKRGCSTLSSEITVVLPGIPDASFTYSRDLYNFTLTANGSSGKHAWQGPFVNTDTTSSVTVNLENSKGTNVKIYHIRTVNGCQGKDSLTISVPDITGSATQVIPGLAVFPNPVNTEIQVQNPFNYEMGYSLFSSDGKLLQTGLISSGLQKIDVSMFPKGVYQLKLRSQNQEVNFRTVIQR